MKKYARLVLDYYNEQMYQYNKDKEIEEMERLLEDVEGKYDCVSVPYCWGGY